MLGLFVFKPGGYVPVKNKSSSFILKNGENAENMKTVSDTEDQIYFT